MNEMLVVDDMVDGRPTGARVSNRKGAARARAYARVIRRWPVFGHNSISEVPASLNGSGCHARGVYTYTYIRLSVRVILAMG